MSQSNAYKTKSKEEIVKVSKEGEVETWYRIYATSAGGADFHIDVPEDQLDNAEALLAARAKKLDSI